VTLSFCHGAGQKELLSYDFRWTWSKEYGINWYHIYLRKLGLGLLLNNCIYGWIVSQQFTYDILIVNIIIKKITEELI
jgi:hypothetical protein